MLAPELVRARLALETKRRLAVDLDRELVAAVVAARAAGHTQAQVAAALGLTHAGIRKIMARAAK